MNPQRVPLEHVTVARATDLLRLHGVILDELNKRNVVRSRNAPTGDLAETLAAIVYGGTLARPSEKAWDVVAGDKLIQVKSRITGSTRRASNFSVFRSTKGFTSVVFVTFTPTCEVQAAVEVPSEYVDGNAQDVPWVRGRRVPTGVQLEEVHAARTLTAEFEQALRRLDELTAEELLALRPVPAPSAARRSVKGSTAR